MAKNIKLDDLAAAVMSELEKYNKESSQKLQKGLEKLAKNTAKELKGASPRKSGGYAGGWTAKTVFKSNEDIRITVHNRKKPGLTHLLEHGHAKPNGGRTGARVHIKPAEEKAIQEATKVVQEAYGK